MSMTVGIVDDFRRIVRSLREASRASERRFGVTAAQLFALRALATAPLSVNALAERTLTHQSTVSIVVGRLAARGLVSRVRSTADGRSVTIALTARGRALLKKAPHSPQELLIAGLARLPPRRRALLGATLHELVEAMQLAGEKAGMFFESGA